MPESHAATVESAVPVPQISNRMTVGKASLLLALMIGISRLTGFGRMVVTSHLYGQNQVTDAYNAAFNIPDTISIIIAGGALATGFVPVFTEYLSQGRAAAAQRTFRAMFTLLIVIFGALTLAMIAATYTPWGTMLAPRNATPENLALYCHLLRILLVAQFIFVIGGMFTGTLNALRLFWYPALQPVFFNCGIILFGILGPKFFGAGIESQAWGALFGALAGSLIIQIPAIYRNHLSLKPLWDLRDPGVRRVMRSLLPIVFGLASGQIIAMNLPRFFGAGLGEGAITALDNANRLMQVPIDVLASGPAIALYPTLALLAAQGRFEQMRFELASTLRRILVLTMLATALLVALRVPLIKLLLEHGKFDAADTKVTSTVLLCYAFGIVGLSVQRLLARGFYAMGETKAPVVIGVAAMAWFAVTAYGIIQFTANSPDLKAFAPAALALNAALSINLMALWMGFVLQKRLGGWDLGETKEALWKGALASLAAYFVALVVAKLGFYFMTFSPISNAAGGIKLMAKAALFCAASAAGGGAFLVAAALLRLREVENLTRRLPGAKTGSRFFEETKFPNINEGAGL